jgi:hypothetical protein
MNFKLQILAIGISIATMAIAPSLVDNLASAQDNSTDNQSEITIVDRIIVPANTTTIKANVTVIPINNNTAAR